MRYINEDKGVSKLESVVGEDLSGAVIIKFFTWITECLESPLCLPDHDLDFLVSNPTYLNNLQEPVLWLIEKEFLKDRIQDYICSLFHGSSLCCTFQA